MSVKTTIGNSLAGLVHCVHSVCFCVRKFFGVIAELDEYVGISLTEIIALWHVSAYCRKEEPLRVKAYCMVNRR